MTQEALTEAMGFNSRQTLGAIEAGSRKVSSDELLKFMQVLGCPLDFFTNPFLLVDEAAVSWRAPSTPAGSLAEFRDRVFPIVGLYQHLSGQFSADPAHLPSHLPLSETSSFEEAEAEAESLARSWGLLPIPAKKLETVAQEKLNLLVLMLDAPEGISGAAVHLKKLDAIIINRKEPAGRRNYDLGHELFHVLTWISMDPPAVDTEITKDKRQKRIEDLANVFTSALLMPSEIVKAAYTKRGDQDLRTWILSTASLFEVSPKALYWRLVHLNCISAETSGVEPDSLVGRDTTPAPKLYSTRFVECMHRGLDSGLVSVRKVQDILDLDLDALESVFREHGLNPPFNL